MNVLTSTSEQAEETTSKFNALTEQISQDCEGLSWLRSLTQRVEHSDVSTDTAHVADPAAAGPARTQFRLAGRAQSQFGEPSVR